MFFHDFNKFDANLQIDIDQSSFVDELSPMNEVDGLEIQLDEL